MSAPYLRCLSQDRSLSAGRAAATRWLGLWIALAFFLAPVTQAQTYQVLHSFGGVDGAYPFAGLSMDSAGNLYGTTDMGGMLSCTQYPNGCGTVFKLKHSGSGWSLNSLYKFPGGSGGAGTMAEVAIGADGSLYGTTDVGGILSCSPYDTGCGTVYKVRPPERACATALCSWNEVVLYSFMGGADGALPGYGKPVFDSAGNLYNTVTEGGSTDCLAMGCGLVYKLTPLTNGWAKSVVHLFTGVDGQYPAGGVIFDNAGNIYGTTALGGGAGYGVVFELTPSGSGWTETVLYSFQGGSDGQYPEGGLVFDGSGNIYGATSYGGVHGGGTVFELAPSGDGWTFQTLYNFGGSGFGPYGALVMDQAGNLYGTTYSGGSQGFGAVFKLTQSDHGWSYISLHDFTGGDDGGNPGCGVMFDASGNLYGTASTGGVYRDGIVWQVTP
jgi:uncharacterized repeat protein (TIGR03803 family)